MTNEEIRNYVHYVMNKYGKREKRSTSSDRNRNH